MHADRIRAEGGKGHEGGLREPFSAYRRRSPPHIAPVGRVPARPLTLPCILCAYSTHTLCSVKSCERALCVTYALLPSVMP